MNSLMLMPLVMPLMLPGGFDGVEPYSAHSASLRLCVRNTTTSPLKTVTTRRCFGIAATARAIGCHPIHLTYIMHGQRKPNDTLRRRLARMGITCTVDGEEF